VCELLAMSSRQATRLTFSLEVLSSHSAAPGKAREGWGVAFYAGNDVALFREPGAASDSPLVRHLESGGPSTTLAISHIRHATQGAVSLANTQPFVRELAGSAHVFAHNGDLLGDAASRILVGDRYRPMGTTDSELAFCALLERLHVAYGPSRQLPGLEQRLDVVAAFAADLRTLGPANFLYADSDALFAHGHRRFQPATGSIAPPGLHRLSRRCAQAETGVDCQGVCVAGGFQDVTLVASFPLSDEGWRPLAEGEVVAISAGQVRASRRL
jgi:predicted glutamine amidotransferase